MKLINFDKYVKLGRIVTEFSRFQQPFNLAILPDVQNWLTNVLAEKGSSSIDALYRKSREYSFLPLRKRFHPLSDHVPSVMLEPRQGTESISNSILDRPAWLGGRI
jgi:son of sevenless-like protein